MSVGLGVGRDPEPGMMQECRPFDPNLDSPRTASYTWSNELMITTTQETLINFISLPSIIPASRSPSSSDACLPQLTGVTTQPLPSASAPDTPPPSPSPTRKTATDTTGTNDLNMGDKIGIGIAIFGAIATAVVTFFAIKGYRNRHPAGKQRIVRE